MLHLMQWSSGILHAICKSYQWQAFVLMSQESEVMTKHISCLIPQIDHNTWILFLNLSQVMIMNDWIRTLMDINSWFNSEGITGHSWSGDSRPL